jgi:P-type Mg2+ transporter
MDEQLKLLIKNYWSLPIDNVLLYLKASENGLTDEEAQSRLTRFGPNLLKPKKGSGVWGLLIGQFKSPIILILMFAASLAFVLHDRTDALIILVIVLISGLLGFWQERGAASALQKLLALVQIKARVLRNGGEREIGTEEIVPGDIILFAAGDLIPSDCLLLESRDLFIDEATLTGETYPVEKSAGAVPEGTPLGKRINALFMGTHVISGSAKAVVVCTGKDTEFGAISEELKLRPPVTEFERGVRRFGYLLSEITLILVIAIFACNVYFRRPILDSLLFALALAVGLTPQLLPAIISINLATGAKRMAQQQVIVKRLASIENFGSMNVLCSDKTGTLTEGVASLQSAVDVHGQPSEKVLLYAYINSTFETGFTNPIDTAIRNHQHFDLEGWAKLDEIPYDFIRKRLTVLVSNEGRRLMISKGALSNVIQTCTSIEEPDGIKPYSHSVRQAIQEKYESFGMSGYRVLGVAYRAISRDEAITPDHEADMTFLGFLVFYDPPKTGIADTIKELRTLGVELKIITGDSRLVVANLSGQLGIIKPEILTGEELKHISDDALIRRSVTANIFAEVEPNQKQRIITALKKAGKVVGFIGDGINDASALHTADVGISVDSAVDVAKEAADIVLLKHGLDVLVVGIKEGRATFANTLKYVFMATSANFGNMFSMAGASLFLPFLPLLPKQILLTNLLTDFPEMAIATDNVDPEMINSPRKWDIKFIRNFMLVFGLLSSVFDYLTFGVLLLILKASPEQFRTGWFVESVISASLIVMVIRSRKPFFKSRPGLWLSVSTAALFIVTLIIPFTFAGKLFRFSPPSLAFLLMMGMIVIAYIVAAELLKRRFYRASRRLGPT